MFRHAAYYTVTRVEFFFRKGRKTIGTTHMGTVYAVVHIEGQEPGNPVSTCIRCTRKAWDELRDLETASYEAKDLNRKITLWEDSIYAAAKNLRDEGEVATPTALVEEKNRAGNNIVTLARVYKQFVEHKKRRVGHSNSLKRQIGEISPVTFQTYHKRWVRLEEYLKVKRFANMPAHKADSPFIQAYYSWLGEKLSLTTATKYAKLLTEMLTWAVQNGVIKNMHIQGFRGQGTADKPPHNVTEEEVKRIEALDFSLDPKMARIRDGWLLARELCLHWADYVDLKPEHFTLNKHNQVVFDKPRQKQEAGRNIRQIAYVSERALTIWRRYGHKIPYVCPNGTYNYALAEIGYLAELNEPLVFSHARDSGIFRWVTLGVTETQIRLAAGWRSMRQLTRYVNLDRRLLDELPSPTSPPPGRLEPSPFQQVYRAS